MYKLKALNLESQLLGKSTTYCHTFKHCKKYYVFSPVVIVGFL